MQLGFEFDSIDQIANDFEGFYLDDVPGHERSQAVGTFSLFFDLSQAVGAPLLGLVVALSSERAAFFVAGIAAGAGFWAQHRLRAADDAAELAAIEVRP